jgi:RNA polymerase sigma factor (sigma-70 family)
VTGADGDALLERLRANSADGDAWTELYQSYWPFVFSVAYRECRGHRDLAEEVAQEVFVKLLRTQPFDRLPNASKLRGYLYTATTNTAKTALGRLAARAETPLFDSGHEPQSPDVTEARLVIEELRLALAPLDREILNLIEAGFTLSEVAAATGLSYTNTAVRLHRLRRQLQRLLGQPERQV